MRNPHKHASTFRSGRLHYKIRNRTRRLKLIGDWFESLYHNLLPGTDRGTRLRNNFQNGDLTIDDLLFEIKGSSNGQKPIIPMDQFNELMGNVPFPYSHLLYVISFYRVLVWRNGRTKSQLEERTRTPYMLDAFLAQKTKDAFVVHHRLLQHLVEQGKCENVWDRGPAIRLPLGYLRRLTEDTLLLRRLGLRSETFEMRAVFRARRVGPITMTVIAPQKVITKVRRLFARSLCGNTSQRTA